MGVAKINKLELYVHNSVTDSLVASLQEIGSCEIISCEEENSNEKTSGRLQELDTFLSEGRFLLRFLEPYYQDPISPISRALGEKPSMSLMELSNLSSEVDIVSLSEDMRKLERRLVEIRSELSRISGKQEMLEKLGNLEYPLEFLSSGTETTGGFLGTIAVGQLEEWQEAISRELGSDAEVFVVPPDKKDRETWVALFYFRGVQARAVEICSNFGISRIDVSPDLNDTVPVESKKLDRRRQELKKEEGTIEKEVARVATDWVPAVRALSDYWSLLRSREEVLQDGEYTDQVVIIKAWVPEDKLDEIKAKLASYDHLTEIVSNEPEEEDEPPTLMQNSKWVSPFESLTKLYGPPKYGSLDPTPLLAPFYFIFFGMCLGDGGYGLVTLGFFLFFVKKFRKMPGGMKQFFMLFVFSGIASVIVGSLTGGWFGDMIDAFPFLHYLQPLKNLPVILDPMNDPMTFLGISLALGVIQVLFGLGVAFYCCIRRGDYIGAFGDQGGWIVFLVGLMVFGGAASNAIPESYSLVGKLLSLAGAAILILTQGREKESFLQKGISGVLSLYNVTSYLGDILSYSRLLALGLATSAVAMIINMLSVLVTDIPVIGWVMAIVLCLGGHLFSLAVNVLGAFVHSLRLQYVEFFSKFYTGGGRSFEPLGYNTQYVDIAEDNSGTII